MTHSLSCARAIRDIRIQDATHVATVEDSYLRSQNNTIHLLKRSVMIDLYGIKMQAC
jgi:hypothetical protein